MRMLAQLLIIKQNWLTTIIEEKDTIFLGKFSGYCQFIQIFTIFYLLESQTSSPSVTSSTMEILRFHSIMLRHSLGMLHRMKRRTIVNRASEFRVLLDRTLMI